MKGKDSIAKITVVMPTYNRSACIQYQLENYFNNYSGNLFIFEIHDSSTNDETQEMIQDCNNEKIRYLRYSSSINGDIKTMQAIQNVKTDYYFLLGDGVCVDFNALEKHLMDIDYLRYGVVGYRSSHGLCKAVHKDFDTSGTTDINEPNEFFMKYFWALTLYGSAIVKKELILSVQHNAEKYMDIASPFMHVCTMFEGIARNGSLCAFTFVDFIKGNPFKQESGWKLEKRAIEFFCYKYYESVLLLPDCYNKGSRKFLTSHNTYSNLFGFIPVLRLRQSGNITFQIVKKYRFYIKQTVAHHIKICIALCFPRFLLNWAKKIHKICKRG